VAGAVRQSIAAGQDFLQRAEERVVRAPEAALEETLLRTLRSLKIPSQREMSSFDRRLRELSQRVEELAAATGHPATATPGRGAGSPAKGRSRAPGSKRAPSKPPGEAGG